MTLGNHLAGKRPGGIAFANDLEPLEGEVHLVYSGTKARQKKMIAADEVQIFDVCLEWVVFPGVCLKLLEGGLPSERRGA